MTEAIAHIHPSGLRPSGCIWVIGEVEVINGLSLLLTRFSHKQHSCEKHSCEKHE